MTIEEQEYLKYLAARDAIDNGGREQGSYELLKRDYERAKKEGKVEEFNNMVKRHIA